VVVEEPELRDLRRVVVERRLASKMFSRYCRQLEYEAVRGGEEGERTLHAGGGQLVHGVCEERVPVPVAEVDRQVDPVRGQLCAQRDDERPVLLVERADSANRR